MRTVQASEAEARLATLLDDVERGETLVITRHGKAIARLVPEATPRVTETERVMREIEKFRKSMPRLSLDELLSARHEGHGR